jgi:hypothetical protein
MENLLECAHVREILLITSVIVARYCSAGWYEPRRSSTYTTKIHIPLISTNLWIKCFRPRMTK